MKIQLFKRPTLGGHIEQFVKVIIKNTQRYDNDAQRYTQNTPSYAQNTREHNIDARVVLRRTGDGIGWSM